MLLLIDNYDSFTWNLVQYFSELGEAPRVIHHDELVLPAIRKLSPDRIVISPGPGTPERAGISCDVIREFAGQIPILGVCLGHQCIGTVFGAKVVRDDAPVHGKTSRILHDESDLFRGIPSPFVVTRYHSLLIDPTTLPAELAMTARTECGRVMAIAHREIPLVGVQFHPEAILTEHGHLLLRNFLQLTR